MAVRGSVKWFSLRQERKIAKLYRADLSPSSGASVRTKGDAKQATGVRLSCGDQMFECKHVGTFDKPAASVSIKLDTVEKIADEAYAESRVPVLCLAIYAPGSPLADLDGEVNLVVRLLRDDITREWALEDLATK